MPGFSQFLDVENSVKLLNNLKPAQFDVADWETFSQLRPVAEKLVESAHALAEAASGSQKQIAQDLEAAAQQLVEAIKQCFEEATKISGMDPDQEDIERAKLEISPVVATISGAIDGLPTFIGRFDEKKLKAKRFIFS